MELKNKIIIAGGRDFDDYRRLVNVVGSLTRFNKFTLVSGMATGADSLGLRYARQRDIKNVLKFPAEWDIHGKAAGPIRNAAMADAADTLIAFWDGKSRGTKNMIDVALSKGLTVHVYQYGEEAK